MRKRLITMLIAWIMIAGSCVYAEGMYSPRMQSVNRALMQHEVVGAMRTSVNMPIREVRTHSTSRELRAMNEGVLLSRVGICARELSEPICLSDIEAEEADTMNRGQMRMPPPTKAPVGSIPWLMMGLMIGGYAMYKQRIRRMGTIHRQV